MILCPDSKRASIELSRKLSIKGYLCTIFKSVVSSIKYKQRRKKKERSQDLQKISLPALEFAILKHRAWSKQVQDQTPLEFFWQFLNESSVLFCSVFFWFMLPKVWKYDRDFYSTTIDYSIIKKLDLLPHPDIKE